MNTNSTAWAAATAATPPDDAIPAPAMRLLAIDLVRGLVIVLMALDHVRDYFTGTPFAATDLTQTTPLLFFTRWITHFCAPVFVLLAGTSAFLMSQRLDRAQLARLLWTRGLWLVVLEWTVVTFAWTFNFDYSLGLIMQVIWAIGMSMIVLAALVRLPTTWIGAIGVLMIVAHNLTDGIAPESFGVLEPLWRVLHVQGPLAIGGTPVGFVLYPLVPWIGVMAAGYALGQVYLLDAAHRRRILLALGMALCAGFVALRAINAYGDPAPWSGQDSAAFTLLSFLNTTKYPPSLLYLLMTLGPALLLLAACEHARGTVAQALATFGRVPLFAYVLHIVLVHLFAGLVALATGYGTAILTDFFLFYPNEWGYGLPVVYLAWLVVIALLYPACRWFADLKRRRRTWWLSYC